MRSTRRASDRVAAGDDAETVLELDEHTVQPALGEDTAALTPPLGELRLPEPDEGMIGGHRALMGQPTPVSQAPHARTGIR